MSRIGSSTYQHRILMTIVIGMLPLHGESRIYDLNGVTLETLELPSGRFRMGNEFGDPDEMPVQPVSIGYTFFIGKYEITREQFEAFAVKCDYITDAEKERQAMIATEHEGWQPSPGTNWRNLPFEQGAGHPVSCVSWHDAMLFCRWLSDKTGYCVTLPTVAEWEYACRAGTPGDVSGSGDLDEMGWYRDNSARRTHAVGMKQPNDWGISDMHGNVWEWNLDMWQDGCQDLPSDGSPWMDSERFIPMESGGSFDNPPAWCASHIHLPSGWKNYNHGFRIVVKNPGVDKE